MERVQKKQSQIDFFEGKKAELKNSSTISGNSSSSFSCMISLSVNILSSVSSNASSGYERECLSDCN